MKYIKTAILFYLLYFVLTLSSILINNMLGIKPVIGLNIAVIIITILLLIKVVNPIKMSHKKSFFFPTIGGCYAVITTYFLSVIFEDFIQPSFIESAVTFVFNLSVVYATLYFAIDKKQEENSTSGIH